MPLSLKAAAESVGLNKSSLLRAIQKGRLSAVRNESGEWEIDGSELSRVFPSVEQRKVNDAKHQGPLQAEIDGLKGMAELLRQQLADVRSDRDHWRDQAMTALRQLPIAMPAPPRPRSWLPWRRTA